MNAREGFRSAGSGQRRHSLIARLGHDELVEGAYRLHDLRVRERADGLRVWQAGLSDRTGTIQAYRLATGVSLTRAVCEDQLIFASFRTRRYKGRLVADLAELDDLGEKPDPAMALDRLPRQRAYRPEALDKLHDLMQTVRDPILKGVLERMIADDRLMFNLIAREDDLFARTVAAAIVVPARLATRSRTREAQAAAIIACFVRAIGRLEIVGEGPSLNPLHADRGWASRALLRCSAPMDWLRGRGHDAAVWVSRAISDVRDPRWQPVVTDIQEAVRCAERSMGIAPPN